MAGTEHIMTTIRRLGFKPAKLIAIESKHFKTIDEISIVIPVKDNQRDIDLFFKEFFRTHAFLNFPREIIIVDNTSCPAIEIEDGNFPIAV